MKRSRAAHTPDPAVTSVWRRLRSLTSAPHRRSIVLALLTIGILFSGLSARTVAQLEASRRQEQLDGTAVIVRSRVERITADAVDALESMRPLWQLRASPTQAEFKTYARTGLADGRGRATTYAGLPDIAFVRAIAPGQIASFTQSVMAERPRRYEIDLRSGTPHHVIDFHTSDALLGVDIHPLPDGRRALEAARDRGTAVASEWFVELTDERVPAQWQRQMALIAVPVYDGGRAPATVTQRRRRLIGWLVAPLFARDVVRLVAQDLTAGIALYGGSTERAPIATIGPAPRTRHADVTLDVLGQTWTVRVGSTAGVPGEPVLGALSVFVAGICLTLLLTALFWVTSRLGAHSERRATTATARLRERDAYVRVLADRVPVGVADLDVDGRVLWANERLSTLTGLPVARIIGADWTELVHPDDRDDVAAAHATAVQGGQAFTVRHRVGGDDERWVEKAGAPTLDDDGNVVRIVAVISDISAMVEFEEQLRAARVRAVEASRLKSEFLANMSHEIRTPLNGVIGMADVLSSSELTATQQSKVATLRTAASQLRDLLNDILDLSKIEAGRLDLDDTEFEPAGTIADIANLMAPSAFDKELLLLVDIDDGMPARVRGPQLRLRQVLRNLLGNAIKFTEHGEIRVAAGIHERDDDRVSVRFAVSDTGIGISPAAIESVFDPFIQADASDTRAYGGSGLGLAISRQLVEMMGGRLQVDSTAHEGSTFSFTVSFQVVRWLEPATTHQDPDGDDAAADRVTAVRAAIAAHEPSTRPEPVARRSGDPASRAGATSGRLLVIEDNPINQEVARELLATLGYDVEVADNGATGVEAYRSGRFDAILMDCQMPVMDGYDATARIRDHEASAGARTPIIAMTAAAMVGDRQRCLAAGMDDYVSKPVNLEILTETLSRWVDAGGDGVAEGVGAPVGGHGDHTDRPPVIDWHVLHQLSVVPGLLERSRRRYLDNARDEIDEMRTLADGSDPERLRALAHKLKGASLTLGAARLGGLLQEVERMAVDLPDTVAGLLDLVEEAFAELREALLTTGNA